MKSTLKTFYSSAGSRVQRADVHRHPRVLHRQEDYGYDAGQKGHLPQLRAGTLDRFRTMRLSGCIDETQPSARIWLIK